jgi:hypothetical protein
MESKLSLDEIIEKTLSELTSDPGVHHSYNHQKIPSARHDPKSKRITVTYYFGQDIKTKLIKDRNEWMNLWDELDFTNVQFDAVESFLSSRTAQKTKEALKKYARKYPDHFSAEIYNCAYLAIFENPKFRPSKSRKPSPYGGSVKTKVTELAPRLYIYLQQMGKQPENSWPPFFKKFLDAYEIPEYNPKPLSQWGHDEIKDTVKVVISEYIDPNLSERMWQTFVTDRHISIKSLKKFSHLINPDKDKCLSDLFKKFRT